MDLLLETRDQVSAINAHNVPKMRQDIQDLKQEQKVFMTKVQTGVTFMVSVGSILGAFLLTAVGDIFSFWGRDV